jgi:hypothetical protein
VDIEMTHRAASPTLPLSQHSCADLAARNNGTRYRGEKVVPVHEISPYSPLHFGAARRYEYHTGDDFTVIKFAGSNGTEQWRQVINGTANGSDQALAVAVDAAGNVVATGQTNNTDTLGDFTVVKLRGANGGDFAP